MFPVSLKTMLCCFLRTYLMGSGFNTRGMQNIGLAFAIDPALREIYPDTGKLQKARRRYIKLYNTHHLWNHLMVALFIDLEKKISQDLVPPQTISKIKSTLGFTLSAIGDSFFSGSLLITWSLLTIILLFLEMSFWALILGITLLLAIQIFKLFTFYMGATQSLSFINELKKWDLINWGSRLKILNSLLVPAFWLIIWPFNWHIYSFIWASVCGLVLAYFYRTLIWAREILLLFILILIFFVPGVFSWLNGQL
ncbi:MAG: PTS system mannose/fructose/sorbose family transporter subunit IID [Desulfonatronovibrio sp.]